LRSDGGPEPDGACHPDEQGFIAPWLDDLQHFVQLICSAPYAPQQVPASTLIVSKSIRPAAG
jgi:hypothetical protein